jgi:hypothetical protein
MTERPLFLTDDELADILLGKGGREVWKAVAPLYEREGMPKPEAMMPGPYRRFWPAVEAWFHARYGLGGARHAHPKPLDGKEDWSKWQKSRKA